MRRLLLELTNGAAIQNPYQGSNAVIIDIDGELKKKKPDGTLEPIEISNISSMTDVTVTSPNSGEVLSWDGTKWINTNITVGGSSVSTINDLTDVSTSGLVTGQVLTWNGTYWDNENLPSATGDMLKSIYDLNDNGIVDNSEQLGGFTSSYYLNRLNHFGTQSQNTITNLVSDLGNKQETSEKGQPNGYAPLDGSGFVPAGNLDLSSYMLQSFYDANTDGVVNDSDKLGGFTPSYYLNRSNQTGTQSQSTITNLISDLASKQNLSEKAQPNGYCDLDSNGKVPMARINLSSINYKNSWDAYTNNPSLSDGQVGATAGDSYIVGIAGTHSFTHIGTTHFDVGDLVIYSTSAYWERVPGSYIGVSSFNGQVGAVSLTYSQISPLTAKGQLLTHNGTAPLNYNGYYNAGFEAVVTGSTASAGNASYGVKISASNTSIVYGVNSTVTQTGSSIGIGSLYGLYVDSYNGLNNYGVIVNRGRSGFGTTSPTASAMLEISSTQSGFLPPRMTGAQAEAISSPAEGLMIYSTDGSGLTITSKGWWGYDGSTWLKLN